MAIQIIKAWQIWEYDGGDGRNNRPTNQYFTSQEAADSYKKSNCYNQVNPAEIILIGCVDDLEGLKDQVKKQRALNKLTKEERILLGLE